MENPSGVLAGRAGATVFQDLTRYPLLSTLWAAVDMAHWVVEHEGEEWISLEQADAFLAYPPGWLRDLDGDAAEFQREYLQYGDDWTVGVESVVYYSAQVCRAHVEYECEGSVRGMMNELGIDVFWSEYRSTWCLWAPDALKLVGVTSIARLSKPLACKVIEHGLRTTRAAKAYLAGKAHQASVRDRRGHP
jgi:hypothetical protein